MRPGFHQILSGSVSLCLVNGGIANAMFGTDISLDRTHQRLRSGFRRGAQSRFVSIVKELFVCGKMKRTWPMFV